MAKKPAAAAKPEAHSATLESSRPIWTPRVYTGLIIVVVIIVAAIIAGNHKSSSSGTVCGGQTLTETSSGVSSGSPFKGCFDQHFSQCSPATISVTNQLKLSNSTAASKLDSVKYQILSRQGFNCLVKWQYTFNALLPKEVGPTVTCPYDQHKDFQAALRANVTYSGCTGPLLSDLKNPPKLQ